MNISSKYFALSFQLIFSLFIYTIYIYLYRRLVGSVGRAPVCLAGGHGFEPWPDQHLGSLNNWEESAAFVMTSANG